MHLHLPRYWQPLVIIGLLLIIVFTLLRPVAPIAHAQDTVLDMAWSPDGSLLAVVTYSRLLVYPVADPATALEIHEVNLWEDNIMWLAFSPDNTRLALNHTVYDTQTGDIAYTLESPHNAPVAQIAFSPDSRVVVVGDASGWLHVADAITGDMLHTNLNGYTAYESDEEDMLIEPIFDIVDLAFSLDGTRLASADWGGYLAIWDTVTWEPIGYSFPYSSKAQRDLQFTPDGTYLLTRDSWNYPHLWEVASMTDVIPEALYGTSAAATGYLSDGRPYAVILDEATRTPRLVDLLSDTATTLPIEVDNDFPNLAIWPTDVLTYYYEEGTTFIRLDLTSLTTQETTLAFRPPVATSSDGTRTAFVFTLEAIGIWDGVELTTLPKPIPEGLE